MSISLEEVLKISRLARLHIDAEKASQYAADLSSILAWVQQMDKVDTRGVETHGSSSGCQSAFAGRQGHGNEPA